MKQNTMTIQLNSRTTKLLIGVVVVFALINILLVLLSKTVVIEDTSVHYLSVPSVFGVVVDKNMTVIHVEKGSAAEKAGVQRGDVLIKLNNQSIKSLDEVRQHANAGQLSAYTQEESTRPTVPTSITVSRGGRLLHKTITLSPPVARPNQPTPTPVPSDELYF